MGWERRDEKPLKFVQSLTRTTTKKEAFACQNHLISFFRHLALKREESRADDGRSHRGTSGAVINHPRLAAAPMAGVPDTPRSLPSNDADDL